MGSSGTGTPCGVARNIENIRDDMGSTIAEELDAVWQSVKDLAVDLCPKESGALASSIELESEGGSGTVSASQDGEIYSNSIYAGNDSTFNFDGESTALYAVSVHDGHMMADGSFWEGTPFLEDALDAYESEIDAAIDRALAEILGD